MHIGAYLGIVLLSVPIAQCPPQQGPSNPDAGGSSPRHHASGVGISSGSGSASSRNFRLDLEVGGHTPVGSASSPNHRVTFGEPGSP